MIWIDIGVALLLTLRMTLLRPSLPRLLEPINDGGLPEGKDEHGTASLL
jgi:hypothetical protein